jgi:hypothetical protein
MGGRASAVHEVSGGKMKLLRWLKWQFFRLLGYGNCWECKEFAPLSWLHVKFTDKTNQTQVEMSGHFCSPCWHKRMEPWKKKMDEFTEEFNKTFKGF